MPTDPFSLQGALQLKRDFDLVREALQLEEYELSAEVKQLVFSLRVFQQMDNAVACLLQQPSKGALSLHSWDALQKCCECRLGGKSWRRVVGTPPSFAWPCGRGALDWLEWPRAGIWSHRPQKGPSSEDMAWLGKSPRCPSARGHLCCPGFLPWLVLLLSGLCSAASVLSPPHFLLLRSRLM